MLIKLYTLLKLTQCALCTVVRCALKHDVCLKWLLQVVTLHINGTQLMCLQFNWLFTLLFTLPHIILQREVLRFTNT